MVVAGSGDDIVVADSVDGLHGYIAGVSHHVVMCFTVVVLAPRVVHRCAVRLDTQARSAVGAVAGKDGVAAAVARKTLHRGVAGAELGTAESGGAVELDRCKARTLDHHLTDTASRLP